MVLLRSPAIKDFIYASATARFSFTMTFSDSCVRCHPFSEVVKLAINQRFKGMRVKMFLAFLLLTSLTAQATALPAPQGDSSMQAEARYRIYDATGKAASIDDVLLALDKIEVACIGELHDDAGGHAFEAELLKRAFEHYSGSATAQAKRRTLSLSLEMFERDVQTILDEYLRGLISERHFLLSSRPWNNYQKDYRPLVEFAREHNLMVIAANAPARYVNRVSRLGPNSLKELTSAARAWLPPLPYEAASQAYAAKFKQLMTGTQTSGDAQSTQRSTQQSAQSPHGASYLLDAQSLRDATDGPRHHAAIKATARNARPSRQRQISQRRKTRSARTTPALSLEDAHARHHHHQRQKLSKLRRRAPRQTRRLHHPDRPAASALFPVS
jgi:uncharacterized iron-regulated protein